MPAGSKEEVLVLEGGEGEIVLQRPLRISAESYHDVEDWLNLMLRKLKRAVQPDDENHLVGIGNLRVMISQQCDKWVAEGLEIDYFAESSSLNGVQEAFQDGLGRTISEHMKLYGGTSNLLAVAPPEVWKRFFAQKEHHVHTQVAAYETPLVSSISFLEAA